MTLIESDMHLITGTFGKKYSKINDKREDRRNQYREGGLDKCS